MPRSKFDRALNELHQSVVTMSLLAEQALHRAVQALRLRDEGLMRAVMEGDEEVDRMEVEIERACLSLLARQQPLAQDLRQVMAVLKMITDIERIADQAADICEMALELAFGEPLAPPETLYEMGACAAEMVRDAIHAYLHQDEEQALGVVRRDEVADELFAQTVRALTQEMRRSPGSIEGALRLCYVAKYLERVADHATNVAEWAIFRITGEMGSLQ